MSRHLQEAISLELREILSFWIRHSCDHLHGGFIGRMDNRGMIWPDAAKGGVLNPVPQFQGMYGADPEN